MLFAAALCGCSGGDDGVEIYSGHQGPAVELSRCLLRTRDGSVLLRSRVLSDDAQLLPIPRARAVDECQVIVESADLFDVFFGPTDPAMVVARVPGPVDRFVGSGLIRRADGSVFRVNRGLPIDSPSLTNVTACARRVCLRDGRLIVSFLGAEIPFAEVPVDVQSGSDRSGDLVLTRVGHVYALLPGGTTPDVLTRIDGLPPIVQLRHGFLEDAGGRIWYSGGVRFTSPGLPLSLLPPGTAEHPCAVQGPKVVSSCVDAIEIAVLRGSIPYLLSDEVLAIMANGTVRCWTNAEAGTGCAPF